MAKYKLQIVRPECIGCEMCTRVCPDLFKMADDGLSTLIGGHRTEDNDEQDLDEEKCSMEACQECPVNCIHLFEDGNKLI